MEPHVRDFTDESRGEILGCAGPLERPERTVATPSEARGHAR